MESPWISTCGRELSAEDEPLPRTLAEFLSRHLTWVLSLLPFVLAGFKLLTNSGGDIQVLRYLVQNVNIVVLLLSSVVPLIPLAVFWLYVIGIEWLFVAPQDFKKINIPEWLFIPFLGGLIAVVIYMPTGMLIANGGLLVFYIVFRKFFRWLRRNDEDDPLDGLSMRADFLQGFMLTVVASLFTIPSMWLPIESMEVGELKMSGYVLSISDQWTTILDRHKNIQIITTSDLKSRRPCGTNSWVSKPLLELWSNPTKLVTCPS
ncbi:hypothetical protein ACM0CQ_13435 [Mycobacteroides abscessus subsp. abscessus]|uniref:hypothetical protein n=1 Tax=Mycobacteroides abscessus TaxID=36809 RepID=UPI0039EF14B0